MCTKAISITQVSGKLEESAHPKGQHPRAKKRQQYFVPFASARVYPASRRMTQRDCECVLLFGTGDKGEVERVNFTDIL